MISIEEYSNKNLKSEMIEIANNKRKIEITELDIYEKAIIYKYSNDGYESTNEKLRESKGKIIDEFGTLLNLSLNKLPNFEELVYRGAKLNELEIKKYLDAYKNKLPIREYSFISTSKGRLIAMAFRGNVLFRISSKTGKDIEKISKFGEGFQNEKEVLFKANCNFRVLDITKEDNYTLITMEEI